MRITRKIAERVELFDDDTDFGGKSHADEMLDEFMQEVSLPFGSSLKKVNAALVECGLLPYTANEIRVLSFEFKN